MNSVFFSPGSKSFYLQELFPEYEDAGTLPDDVIEITRETYEQFLGLHPEGKEIGADSSGRPIWINSPPPSKEDEVLMAEMKKISLVSEANTYINIIYGWIIWTHWNWLIPPVRQILNGLRLRQFRPDDIRRGAGICCRHRVNVIQHSVKAGDFCLRQLPPGLQFQLNQTDGSHCSINQ